MKKFAIYILLGAVVIQATSQVWVMASFYIQRQYIVKNICINRFNATSTCKGHCYLTKQLKQNEEKQQKLPDIKSKQTDWLIPYFIHASFIAPNLSFEMPLARNFIFYPSNFIFSIFHPPEIFNF